MHSQGRKKKWGILHFFHSRPKDRHLESYIRFKILKQIWDAKTLPNRNLPVNSRISSAPRVPDIIRLDKSFLHVLNFQWSQNVTALLCERAIFSCGLCSAPQVFMKILVNPIVNLWEQEIHVHPYLMTS